mgnify:CR=1 FL=1
MKKQVISTSNAPAAIGPYSQAVMTGDFLYISGQLPVDPGTGKLDDGDIRQQAERALTNVKMILEAAGMDMQHVVKTTVFLKNMDDFAPMNEVYAKFFGENPPARAAVAVAGLPRGALVEIEAVAFRG